MIRFASYRPIVRFLALVCAGWLVSSCGGVDFSDLTGTGASQGVDTASSRLVARGGVVKVESGDTVYGIARRVGVPVRALIDYNRLKPPYRLYVGRKLYIPKVTTHKVSKGETLYQLGRMYDVSIYDIARENDLKPPYTLYVGQNLKLPGVSEVASAGTPIKNPTVTGQTISVAKSNTTYRSARLPNPPPVAGKGFTWPVKGRVVSRFGAKKGGLQNDGINIVAPRGSAVKAAQNGVVAYAGNELKGFGNLLLIKHSNGWVTAYAHNDVLLVKRGDKVLKGQVISKVGSSGNVSSPQLHFEIRQGKRAINPEKYLT